MTNFLSLPCKTMYSIHLLPVVPQRKKEGKGNKEEEQKRWKYGEREGNLKNRENKGKVNSHG